MSQDDDTSSLVAATHAVLSAAMSARVNVFADAKDDRYHFDVVDYVVFGAMLLLSALTGLYFGCRSRYCKSVDAPTLRDYLIGNGNMKSFPVAMSLVAR